MPRPRLNPEKILTPAEKQKAYRERQKQARITERQQKGLPPAPAVPTMPGTARWNALIVQAQAALDTCLEEMQTYFDDRSEQWQESERGEQMQERIDQISELLETLNNIEA